MSKYNSNDLVIPIGRLVKKDNTLRYIPNLKETLVLEEEHEELLTFANKIHTVHEYKEEFKKAAIEYEMVLDSLQAEGFVITAGNDEPLELVEAIMNYYLVATEPSKNRVERIKNLQKFSPLLREILMNPFDGENIIENLRKASRKINISLEEAAKSFRTDLPRLLNQELVMIFKTN